MLEEKERGAFNGIFAIVIWLAAAGYTAKTLLENQSPAIVIGGLLVGAFLLLSLKGFFVVNPNEGMVIQLFGSYAGTVKKSGLKWVNPFCTRRPITLRIRNFETNKIKVNDSTGNPIEIAAVVVWKVSDTAQAVFKVDDYEKFMTVQSESALRNMASHHPYDQKVEGDLSLRSHTEEIAEKLKAEIQQRLAETGISVIESRITHLAYAPEIAGVMLRQQQASAIIAARQKIVEGAVGMVNMALKQITERGLVKMDEERKASMVSNLLVTLCGDRHASPVVNVGSLYQ